LLIAILLLFRQRNLLSAIKNDVVFIEI